MILRIRNSKTAKIWSLVMAFVFIATINPTGSYALTGGPTQPEFNAFTPIGTSDMVDLASGDFSYNIPLMDVGGFPINLAYNSGVTMDQEASWVGLGWDLSIGQINRQMRGLPDDFDGDTMTYENNIKDNWTYAGTFQFSPEAYGVKLFKDESGNIIDSSSIQLNFGLTAQYNSYNGMSLNPSRGVSFDMAKFGSVGFNTSSTPDGLSISPYASLNPRIVNGKKRDSGLGGTVGTSFNSRQGISSYNLSTSMEPAVFGNVDRSRVGNSSVGSFKSIVPNTYTPTIQANMQTISGTYNAALGSEFFGGEGEGEVTAFFSNQFMSETTEDKKAYGYEHTHEAPTDAILDFNREKDGNFSVNSTNLPLTNYTYDLYSVQGQGVGGMFQPFRSQVGYVHDNYTYNSSTDLSGGGEWSTGSAFHTGANIEVTEGYSQTGIWKDDNAPIEDEVFDADPSTDPVDYEEVYFKNVGDLSVDPDLGMYDQDLLGEYNPIRLNIGGGKYARELKKEYLLKGETESADAYGVTAAGVTRDDRVRRNQNILKITALEADELGDLNFERHSITETNDLDHHTAGFIVTRNDGARYSYGKTLYNTTKREVTFAVGSGIGGGSASQEGSDVHTGLVHYDHGEDNSVDNTHGDHYYNAITTPAYGHTYLLTALLSTDYSDIDGVEGPSAGDLGSYTEFQYRDMGTYNWRVPFQKDSANYNGGLNTDPTDDKASYIYGEKEVSYIQKIETKTHVALFYISPREDGYGVKDEQGGLPDNTNTTESKMYKLDRIALYSAGEFYASGVVTTEDANDNIVFAGGSVIPEPIKEVHFVYDYSQCQGIPNNRINAGTTDDLDNNETSNDGGKLTLKSMYFTYRSSQMGKYSPYTFTYGDIDHNGEVSGTESGKRNPNYNLKGYDIWGCYKENPDGDGGTLDPLTAPEFNYVDQNTTTERDLAQDYAAAWSMTDIGLPSGGNIQIDYEADDYQYVQDKEAMRMFKVIGAGSTADPSDTDNDFEFDPLTQTNDECFLYSGTKEATYLYVELDQNDQTDGSFTQADFRKKYLLDIWNNQNRHVQFRMYLNMTKKGGKKNGSWSDEPFDYVSGYFELESLDSCEVFTQGGIKYGSVKMKPVKMEGGWVGAGTVDVSPISKAGWHFGRKYLSKFIYSGADIEGDGGIDAKTAMKKLGQRFDNLMEAFVGPNALLKSKKIAKRFIAEKSWIRLSEPTDKKIGGGCRVKTLSMTDEWAGMTESPEGGIMDQEYGQEYTYELEDGGSSGVATYEPVGSKENPLVQPIFVNTNRLLAPDEENYIEKPFGESFFPSPKITYSRVSVKNLEREEGGRAVKKHATGEVVTEFYTSRDYPVITDQTILQVEEDHNPLLASLLKVNVVKHLTASQGYLVHLNDMNGKMKSQRVYAEGQDGFISGVDYVYDATVADNPGSWTSEANFNEVLDDKGKLWNEVLTIDPEGNLEINDIGIEYNIVNDFREMRSQTVITGTDINAAFYTIGPLPIVVPVPIPDYSRHVDQLRLSTTTKVVNSYGILREVVAHDAGASVSTRNVIWDSETGEVLLTETTDEYGDKYYSLNYPAHWYYKGMGQASFNNGLVSGITPYGDGYQLTGITTADTYLHPGDEVLLLSSGTYSHAWVTDVTSGPEFDLIDKDGTAVDVSSGSIRIIRSGRRNNQSTSMGSIVLMKNPVSIINGEGSGTIPEDFLTSLLWSDYEIVNSGAVEFNEDWALQCECGIDSQNESINPYVHNVKGVWRANKSYLYLVGRHHQTGSPNPRSDGFYETYKPYYNLDYTGGNHWTKLDEGTLDKWTFTSEVTQFSPYGFELENEDALGRKSSAQYGYNHSFPLAVGANTAYRELGFDGFEDYDFEGCPTNEHFGFRDVEPGDSTNLEDEGITDEKSHTGRFSLKLAGGSIVSKTYKVDCSE